MIRHNPRCQVNQFVLVLNHDRTDHHTKPMDNLCIAMYSSVNQSEKGSHCARRYWTLKPYFKPLTTYKQSRGVLNFGFGMDVPPRNLKVDPYKYQFFKKK